MEREEERREKEKSKGIRIRNKIFSALFVNHTICCTVNTVSYFIRLPITFIYLAHSRHMYKKR